MKKFIKIKCIVTLVLILSITRSISFAENTNNLNISRISGIDRYDTSVKISEYMKTYMKPYKNIVVASGELFPDAISAGILSCHLESPLLLVKRNTIPEVVENNIRLSLIHI